METPNNLLEKIKTGQIKMRPRLYFALKTAGIIFAGVVLFLVSAFLVGLVFYLLANSGLGRLPRFGAPGFKIFFSLFPWLPVIGVLLLIFILSAIIKRYPIAYRHPLVYVPAALIAVALLLALASNLFGLHRNLDEQARRHNLFIFGPLYQQYRRLGSDQTLMGNVVSYDKGNGVIILSTPMRGTVSVSIAPDTQFPFGDEVDAGQQVVIIGQTQPDGSFSAIAVRDLATTTPAANDEPDFPLQFFFRDNR